MSYGPPEQVNGFLKKRNIDLPGYYMSDAVEAFELIGFPTTLIINPSGDIVLQVEGADDWNTSSNVAMVKGLINASE